jgi:hypothetical protein
MNPNETIVTSIIDLLGQIQKEQKIGTAFERYESHLLWDLGHNIVEYAKVTSQKSDVVAEIMSILKERSINCQPVILKNAETITKVWPKKEKYLADTKDAPYGKLRDALTILNPDFVNQHKVSNDDQRELIRRLSTFTFDRFRSYVKQLRLKYDPLGETVDFDELFNDIFETTSQLREIVENNDEPTLIFFRVKFDTTHIENTRKLIAAMKSEEMLKKLRSDIFDDNQAFSTPDKCILVASFQSVTRDLLLLFKSSESRRDALRQRIGTSELGKLSTLLKATYNETERQRYIRSRQVLEKLASGNSKGD